MGKAAPTSSRWWLAVTGVLGIAAGLIAFFAPASSPAVLLIFIAIWAIAIGVMAIVGAIQLRKEIEGEWLLILSGALAVLFGILMFLQPAAGALAVIWMIATFAIIFGIDLIWLAFKLKGFKDPRPEPRAALAFPRGATIRAPARRDSTANKQQPHGGSPRPG